MVPTKSILIKKQKWRWGICHREKLYKNKTRSDFTIIRHFCWNGTEKRFLQRVFAILSLCIPSSLGSWVFPYHKSRKETLWDPKKPRMFPLMLDDIEYWLTPNSKSNFRQQENDDYFGICKDPRVYWARVTVIFLCRGTVVQASF